ncbi:MAG TPA: MarR family winged helix-turn-helix transcriptional regulator [Candidatus Micrarchaeia archaeon]|nr:MarR family winged helix-turn-helix transcriptional regulator [Candidatus Micrarchaeia archaeon]
MSGVRWLTCEEQAAWRAYQLAAQLLEEVLERQLQREAGMAHADYAALATLAEAPGGRLRMRELAAALRYSPSRTSHAVARLEARGRARRRACPDDGRGQLAVLTEAGSAALAAAAPGHVAEVRRRVFDRLSPEQVAQLRAIAETVGSGIDGRPVRGSGQRLRSGPCYTPAPGTAGIGEPPGRIDAVP